MPEKPCPNCGIAVEVQPIAVMGRTITPAVLCPRCATEEPVVLSQPKLVNVEEVVRTKLERLGVNVAAHGRYPLSHVLQFVPPDVARAAREFVAEVQDAGKWDPVRGLIIEGPTGVGKSWLAIAIARELIERAVLDTADIRYDRSRWVWGLVRSGYGDGTATAELAARMKARLWILDDFGAEHATDDTAANLTDILSARELRPTILTANVPRDNHAERYNPELWDRVRSRLGDRNFRVIRILGEDKRLVA